MTKKSIDEIIRSVHHVWHGTEKAPSGHRAQAPKAHDSLCAGNQGHAGGYSFRSKGRFATDGGMGTAFDRRSFKGQGNGAGRGDAEGGRMSTQITSFEYRPRLVAASKLALCFDPPLSIGFIRKLQRTRAIPFYRMGAGRGRVLFDPNEVMASLKGGQK